MGLRKTETQASAALPGLLLIQLIAVLIHARADAPRVASVAVLLGPKTRESSTSSYPERV